MSFFQYILFCYRSGVFYFPSLSEKDSYLKVIDKCANILNACKDRQYHQHHIFSLELDKITSESLDALALQLKHLYGVKLVFKIKTNRKPFIVEFSLDCYV
jgi:hypothetical protein